MIIFTSMNQPIYKLLSEKTAHRLSLKFIRDYTLQPRGKLSELVKISWNEKDKILIKGCWSLKLIFENQLKLILPFWKGEELKTILLQDYYKHSAAYQAASKDILRKLK